jgi:undecaprenyl-diphosphatase
VTSRPAAERPTGPSATLPAAIRRRLDPDELYGLRLTLFAIAFLLVFIPFGFLLNEVLGKGSLVRFDTAAARHLHEWVRHSPAAVWALKAVTLLGIPPFLFAVTAPAVLYCWRRKHYRLALFLIVTTLGGGLLDTAVKVAVNRPRPSLAAPIATAHGKSFPSGHAMSSVVVYGSLLLVFFPVLSRRWRRRCVVGVTVLVLAIGFSRLALGVHYISDVLGGYVLGLAWLAASTAAFSIWRVERGSRPVEPMEGLEPEAGRDLSPHHAA